MTHTIKIQKPAGKNQDTTLDVLNALRTLKNTTGPCRIEFEAGRYDFWPDRATEEYLFVSNNDESLKRMAFPIFGFDDLEIDGQGSVFMFHGPMVPFAIRSSNNIRLHNFTIDWARTFHQEALVLDSLHHEVTGNSSVDFKIDQTHFPYTVSHEQLVFLGESKTTRYDVGNILAFDAERKETAFKVHDNYAVAQWHRVEELAAGVVRMTANFSDIPKPGQIAAIGGAGRYSPAFTSSDVDGLTIEDVTLHHCGGMGVIAQCTKDIAIRRLKVTPSEHGGYRRMISATADATHFVNCSGDLLLEDCVFENQLDDATNVHGIYARISRKIAADEVEVELVHGQQLGIDIVQAGDRVEFVACEDLLTYHEAEVASVDRLNKQFSKVKFTQPIPDTVKAKDVIGSLTKTPDNVTIRGCYSGSNRARGFLLSVASRIIVEGNRFHSPGAAILIAGDANYWFESGAVRDVTIRDNHFDNCLFGNWGGAVIDIHPEVDSGHRKGNNYHRNIRIENNRFNGSDLRLLKAHCVDGLTFTGNSVTRTEVYPRPAKDGKLIDISDCANVALQPELEPSRI